MTDRAVVNMRQGVPLLIKRMMEYRTVAKCSQYFFSEHLLVKSLPMKAFSL